MSAVRKEPTLTRVSGPWDEPQAAVTFTPPALPVQQPQPVVTTQIVSENEDEKSEWESKSNARKAFDIVLVVVVFALFASVGFLETLWVLFWGFLLIYLPFAVLRFFWRLLHWKQRKPQTTVVQHHYHYQ